MTDSKKWMRYLGLPFKLGADPENGNATDCVHLVFRVAQQNGVTTPEIKREWYSHLGKRNIGPIMKDWFSLTEQTMGPEQCAMAIMPDENIFAMSIVVDGGLLFVRSSVGVIWAPLSSLKPMNYRRFRNA